MRHNKKFNHLGRTSPHRKAMLSNMAASLIMHKRITTTVAKAKALRVYVEPLINRSKEDTTHQRRMVFRKLQDKNAVTELFREVSPKIAERPGGYTRIIKLGKRLGDNADMCLIELVDFNEIMLGADKKAPAKAKSTRRRGAKKTAAPVAAAPAKAEAEKAPEAVVETVEEVADVAETTELAEEVKPEVEAVNAETAEESPEAKSETEQTEEDKDKEAK